MAHVTLAEVKQWLEPTKLNLNAIDAELEATAFMVVASTLQARYNTALWTDNTNTPDMVQKIISMLIAGYTYNRQYSENEDVATYGNWLIRYATTLLAGLDSGQLLLDSVEDPRQPWSYPSFFPTDIATDLADPVLGGNPEEVGAAPKAFSMGMKF